MESTDDFARKGHDLADKTADKIQGGIQSARNSANSAASNLSSKVETARSKSGPAIDQAADQADSLITRGMNALNDAGQKVRETVADTQDSIVTYTQENPVKALLIAAATGAALVSLIRALAPSRD